MLKYSIFNLLVNKIYIFYNKLKLKSLFLFEWFGNELRRFVIVKIMYSFSLYPFFYWTWLWGDLLFIFFYLFFFLLIYYIWVWFRQNFTIIFLLKLRIHIRWGMNIKRIYRFAFLYIFKDIGWKGLVSPDFSGVIGFSFIVGLWL